MVEVEFHRSAEKGFRLDYLRIRGGPRLGLPIEVLNSMDRLVQARLDFIAALADFNQAQFQLFVALGQNPGQALTPVAD